jgi:hypothetical protein
MQLETELLSINSDDISMKHVTAVCEYMHIYRELKIVQGILDKIQILHIRLQP